MVITPVNPAYFGTGSLFDSNGLCGSRWKSLEQLPEGRHCSVNRITFEVAEAQSRSLDSTKGEG
jgi:hypothetical protein